MEGYHSKRSMPAVDENVENLLSRLEEKYLENRQNFLEESDDGIFLITPLHVLKTMASAYDMHVHSEIICFQTPHNMIGVSSLVHRAEIFVGKYRGFGQARRKKVAVQLAAINLIEKVKKNNPSVVIPDYVLPSGFRIHPSVFSELVKLCEREGLEEPVYKISEQGGGFDRFKASCVIGELEVTGKSDCPHTAKKIVASRMYSRLANSEPMKDCGAMGKNCIGLSTIRAYGYEMKYSDYKMDWLAKNKMDSAGFLFRQDEPADGDEATNI